MKLASIDIGTNSIHMVIAEARSKRNLQVIDREKEMIKLGKGVFSTSQLSERAFRSGVETITRYVQLADQQGVDEIITAATSAIREAQNGGAFLDQVVQNTGISPQVISGEKEARLIFLAVRNAIALKGENAMVLDIGGGSTEVVVGNDDEILFAHSLKLGVLRLLDMFKDEGPIKKEALGVLKAHIRFVGERLFREAKNVGFSQVVGTSGTIRTLGEAAHLMFNTKALRSVNAEVIGLEPIEALTEQLLGMKSEKRSKVEGIGENRADAIHLGGFLLVELLHMAGVRELTLCDASLREGLILDYLETHWQTVNVFPQLKDLRHRSVAQLAHKFDVDWNQHTHVATLALQIFDQTKGIHKKSDFERDILEYSALLFGVGQFLRFRRYHRHSRYIIVHSELRGFNDEEVLLISQVVRYHRKGPPNRRSKNFRRLSKEHQKTVLVLSGILKMAVALDRTKSMLVERVTCEVRDKKLCVFLVGQPETMNLELWAGRRNCHLLEKALDRKIHLDITNS